MKVSGEHTINAPREQVWEAINDLDVLARIVPGCQRLEQTGDNEFEGTLKIGIQAIKGVYNGKIRLEDVTPPEHYRLSLNGKGANGVVDGGGTVDLEDAGGGKTLMKYSGDAKIGGTLASVGQRLIEGTAKQLINQSLKALEEQISQRATASEPAAEAPALAPATPEPAAPLAAPPDAPPPVPAHTPAPPTPPARRTVVVPEDEQLKPESVVAGLVQDFLKERGGTVIALLAFVLGFLFGRSTRD